MRKIFTFFVALFFCATVFADADPMQMLKGTSDEMLSALRSHQSTVKSDPIYVEKLARRILLPHVDTSTMAKLALGRAAWTSATSAQQQEFTNEFITLLIRTYTTALASYTNQSIQFNPLRADASSQTRLQIDSKIIQPGGPSIPVNYRVIKREAAWKVYDISVDGVSMAQSFHSQFANQIAQGGMAGLLSAMKQHNASLGK